MLAFAWLLVSASTLTLPVSTETCAPAATEARVTVLTVAVRLTLLTATIPPPSDRLLVSAVDSEWACTISDPEGMVIRALSGMEASVVRLRLVSDSASVTPSTPTPTTFVTGAALLVSCA